MRDLHEIWHGDSVELCKKFQRKRMVNCIITDPPFGVNNKSKSAVTQAGRANVRKIANDETPEQAIKVFNDVMDVLLPATVDDCDMYIFTSYQVLKEWLGVSDELSRHGFYRKAVLVWEKEGPGQGDLDYYGMGIEFILYLKKGFRQRTGPRRNAVFHDPQVRPTDLIHPHEKPLPLLQRFIEFSTSRGDFIVDPFGGSCSTLRAAKMMGRNCVAIEYDKMNYDRAVKKLETIPDEELF